MKQPVAGTRVVAIHKADAETIQIVGYGVMEGEFVRDDMQARKTFTDISERHYPDMHPAFRTQLIDEMLLTPRIRLDSGERIWGNQVWWLEADRFQRYAGKRPIVVIGLSGLPDTIIYPISA